MVVILSTVSTGLRWAGPRREASRGPSSPRLPIGPRRRRRKAEVRASEREILPELYTEGEQQDDAVADGENKANSKRKSVFAEILPGLYDDGEPAAASVEEEEESSVAGEAEGAPEEGRGGGGEGPSSSGRRKSVFSGLLPGLYEDGKEGGEEASASASPREVEAHGDGAEVEEEKEEAYEDKLKSRLSDLGLNLLDKVGEGGVADIYRAEIKGSLVREARAVKVLREDFRKSRNAQTLFKQEAKLWLKLDHPNVVKAYHYDADLHFVVQEYCPGGSLYSLLASQRKNQSCFPILNAPQIALDLAQGLEYLHRVGVVHRDIKSLNILLGVDRSTGKRIAKICDLGSAILLNTLPDKYYFKPPKPSAPGGTNLISKVASDLFESVVESTFGDGSHKSAFEAVGTPYWMAPEMLDAKILDKLKSKWQDDGSGKTSRGGDNGASANIKEEDGGSFIDTIDAIVGGGTDSSAPKDSEADRPYLDLREITKAMDVYSFGVVLYELFHRAHPWFEADGKAEAPTTREEVKRKIVDEEMRLPLAPYLCREMSALISKCWHPDATLRGSMERAVNTLRVVQRYDRSGSIDVAAAIAKVHLELPTGERVYLGDHEQTWIGRSAGSHVALKSDRVSRKHCFIEVHASATGTVELATSANGKYTVSAVKDEEAFEFYITDCSSNGTKLNKRPLVKGNKRLLKQGDAIIIDSKIVCRFRLE